MDPGIPLPIPWAAPLDVLLHTVIDGNIFREKVSAGGAMVKSEIPERASLPFNHHGALLDLQQCKFVCH